MPLSRSQPCSPSPQKSIPTSCFPSPGATSVPDFLCLLLELVCTDTQERERERDRGEVVRRGEGVGGERKTERKKDSSLVGSVTSHTVLTCSVSP